MRILRLPEPAAICPGMPLASVRPALLSYRLRRPQTWWMRAWQKAVRGSCAA